MEHIAEIIRDYGIFAVFALCTVEGDITLLLSGVMAHGAFFGEYSFLKVFLAGTLGGVAGDNVGYWIGRLFRTKIKHYRFYEMARPRIERLIEKFGGFAIIISKYIYGIRAAMCLFYGIGKMPYLRFLLLDTISCAFWSLMLASVGYFFSGAIVGIIGDFQRAGIWLFFIVLFGILVFYVIERYYVSEKVEEANPNPETIHRIEEKLHLTSAPHRAEEVEEIKREQDKEFIVSGQQLKKETTDG